MLQNIFGWFRASNKQHKSENPFLYPLDLDDLKAELKIEYHAKRLGELGLPNDEKLTGPEAAIKGRLENARRDALSWATHRLKTIHNRLAELDITPIVNRSRQADEEFERQANSLLSEEEAALRSTHQAAVTALRELEQFKTEHRRNRTAKTQSGAKVFTLSMILVLMTTGEAAVNAKLFAASFDGGFMEGATWAFGLAAVNVAWSYCWGRFCLPNALHVTAARKIFGWFSIIPAFFGAVFIGLVTSHFRDALSAGADIGSNEAAKIALATLTQTPFHFADAFSMLLFGMSVGFAIVSYFDGFYWKDSYPGYTYVQQLADEAVDAHEAEVEEVRAKLNDLKEQYLSQLDSDSVTAKDHVVKYAHEIEEKRVTQQRVQALLHQAENLSSSLIALFRSENEIYRKGTPTPEYFKQGILFQSITLPDFDTAPQEMQLDLQRALLSSLHSKTEGIRDRIQSSFISKFDQLKPFRNQINKEGEINGQA
ncbi:hypothetical protein [Pseudomonas sp. S2_A02]